MVLLLIGCFLIANGLTFLCQDFDPNRGELRESSSGLYGALIETDTLGLYTFEFISDPNVSQTA